MEIRGGCMRKNDRFFSTIFLLIIAVLMFCPAVLGSPHPENGIRRQYYANGQLWLETVYKNGLLVRKRAYYRNGKLLLEEKYKNGMALRKASYYDNGKIKRIWTRKSGVTEFYHRDGRLRVVVDSDASDDNENLPSSYLFQ